MGSQIFRRYRALSLAVSIALLAASAVVAHAQASATAERAIGLSVFAGGTLAKTDFNSTNKGLSMGGDVTLRSRFFSPSLDLRYTRSTGDVITQSSFAGGLKAERAIGRVRPYIDLEIGVGNILFNHPTMNPDGTLYTHDNSKIYVIGGGADVPLSRSFSIKADAQYQIWRLGKATGYLTPLDATIGIVYRIPFRRLPPQR